MKITNRKGTNQYQKRVHRIYGLKTKTWKNIIVILLPVFLVIPFGHRIAELEHAHFVSPIPMDSYVVYAEEKKQPTLAPMSEREANIALIKKIWGKDSYIGLAIARAESGYRTLAENHNTNGTVDEGIFQVNSIHGMPEMFNAVANVSYAYSLYLKQGTNPWNSSKHNWENEL